MCSNIIEGIRGVSYHHLASSVGNTTAAASSKYRLPSRYPSSSCPGSNNSSISSPYSPSSQHNPHQAHLINGTYNGGSIPMTPTGTPVGEPLNGTPPAVAIVGSNVTITRPPSCSPVDLTSSSKQLPLSESSPNDQHRLENIRISRNGMERVKLDVSNQPTLMDSTSNAIGGPLTRSRKRKLGVDTNQSSNINHNMPTPTNTSVTITLQVNSASSTSSSTSNNDDDLDNNQVISNNTAQIVPTNRATAPKLQRRGCFEDVPMAQLGLNQQHNHSVLAMMSPTLSSPSYCGSEVASSSTTTTTHAALAVLAATDPNSVISGGSDEHIQNFRSAFANMPTAMATAAATAGGAGAVTLGCRGNAAVTITID